MMKNVGSYPNNLIPNAYLISVDNNAYISISFLVMLLVCDCDWHMISHDY